MYLSFSDWSSFIKDLDRKGIPHGDKIIKVYATREDPRRLLKRPDIFVVESNGDPFTEEEFFKYPGRQAYRGQELEESLVERGLTEDAKERFRAIFRFANLPETQFCQYAMPYTQDGKWVFDHPLDIIDGLKLAARNHEGRSAGIHLDIFSARSLANLRKLFDIDQEKRLVDVKTELKRLINNENGLRLEGRARGREF